MERANEWVEAVGERLGPLTPSEAELALSASVTILTGWLPDWDQVAPQREGDALGAVVAMVELARSLAAGAPLRRQAVLA